VGVEPIGFLVTHNEQISFIPAKNSKGLGADFEKVPDLIEKLMSRKKTEKDEAAV
jgi:uncharacterized spore protein YtfJ